MTNTPKITPSQQQILDYLNTQSGKSTSIEDLNRKFHRTAIKTLLSAGVIITEGHSRLRQDDQEMVFWTEVRVPNDADEVKRLIKV